MNESCHQILLRGFLVNQKGYVEKAVYFGKEEYNSFLKENKHFPRLIICDMQGNLVSDSVDGVHKK